nr:EOG090X0ALT [Moina brachiata]
MSTTSSFQKRTKPCSSSIAGTKIAAGNNTLHVSTGIQSLDAITDGGFPVGSLCLIEEDSYGSYAKVLVKYFLAEGLTKGNITLVASRNESPWDIINALPSPVAETNKITHTPNKDELKIAWRYENLSIEDNATDSVNTYDLSIPLTIRILASGELVNLLTTVQNVIQKWNLASYSSGNLLRIVISSFGSPFWQANADSKEFLATLLVLKSIVRTANAVAIVTLPSQVLSELFIHRAKSLADVVFRLKSLREDPNLQDLMDVHGILEMKKFANLTSLKPLLGQDGTTTYGFKATKRKFKIEKLHLPPSVEVEKQPEKRDPAPSGGCSSDTSTSKYDF